MYFSNESNGRPMVRYALYNYILRLDWNKTENGLKTILCSQNILNALAIDELLEYARLALDGEMQAWVKENDSLEIW